MECLIFVGGLTLFLVLLFSNTGNSSGNDWQSTTAAPSQTENDGLYTFVSNDHSVIVKQRDFGGIEIGERYYPVTDTSPSGRFTAASTGAAAEDGSNQVGMVALLDHHHQQVRWTQRVELPAEVAATDDGNVVVVDTRTTSSSEVIVGCLGGDGSDRWHYSFNAESVELAVSDSGNRCMVAVEYGGADRSEDETFVYDVESGELIFSVDRVRNLGFYGDALVLEVEDEHGEKRAFAYDDSGRLPDEFDRFRRDEQTRRAQHNPGFAVGLLRRETKRDDTDWDRVERILQAALNRADQLNDYERARLHRHAGELAQHRGELQQAIEHWEDALNIDEDVGVKLQLEKVRAQLGGSTTAPPTSPDDEPGSRTEISQSSAQIEHDDSGLFDDEKSGIVGGDDSRLFDDEKSKLFGESSTMFDTDTTSSAFETDTTLFDTTGSSLFDDESSDHYESSYRRAEALRKFGHGQDAIPHYETAIEKIEDAVGSDSELPRKPFRRFAKMLYHMGEPDRAIGVLNRFEQLHETHRANHSSSEERERLVDQMEITHLKRRLASGDLQPKSNKYRR